MAVFVRSTLYKGILCLQYRLSESLAKLACSQGLDNAITMAKLDRLTWYGSHPCLDGFMMTSSNANIFSVTGPLCGEFTGPRWIPRTKASDAELWCFLWSAHWINGWVNNGEAGDLRRHRAHYDVIIMLELNMSSLWTGDTLGHHWLR